MSTLRSTRRALAALALLAALAYASVAAGQTSATYSLPWNRVGSGGRSTSASHIVTGSAGQPSVGQPQATSAGYRLTGGFWYPEAPPAQYLPLITK